MTDVEVSLLEFIVRKLVASRNVTTTKIPTVALLEEGMCIYIHREISFSTR